MRRKERREVGTNRANFLRRTKTPLRAYAIRRTPSLYLRLLANSPRPDV
jgi:hypothetical protein